ncbi:hypothetical protein Adt_03801 [Abeliophyllum distichum]|uniref:Uncharacterized protein n=1 Tax=Abeliophyllum distichum TaxID=126358 RepID=A0ABD1W1Y6_9LAMI
MKFILAGVLGSVHFATDDEGPSSPKYTNKRKTAIKEKGKTGEKNILVSTDRHMEDDHIHLTKGANLMQTDCDQTVGDSLVLNLHFLPLMLGEMWKVMRSCVFSHMPEGLSKRKIEDVEKVLVIYNRKDSVVKACKRMVTDLEVVEDEKSKEVHHLKRKITSLKKFCETSMARVMEREEEIDNIRSTLARAQHDAMETIKLHWNTSTICMRMELSL